MARNFLFVAFPFTGGCCEPIVPLYKLLSGSTLAGPAILTESAWWLLAAVVLKSGAFIFFERRLSWQRAGIYMLLANVLSTIPGVFVAALTSSSFFGFVFALPFILVMGWLVGRRFSRLPEDQRPAGLSAGSVDICFMAVFIISIFIFAFAGSALDNNSFVTYWVLKFIFVTMAACTGIVISAVLEECVLAWMTRKSHKGASFFQSVFRANYITLGIVLLVVAGQMIPKRWHSPHFLASFFQQLSESLGFT